MKRFLQQSDPYQWFFPLSILFGMMSVAIWIFFWLGKSDYPALFHSEGMIGGFLLLAALGFLMTAVPKFTGTRSASLAEKSFGFFLFLLLLIGDFLPSRFLFHATFLGLVIFLLRFGISRLRISVFKPAPPFVLVAFALLYALFSSIVLLINDYTTLPTSLFFVARQLFLYGFFFALTLGVGTQLIPSIMGLTPLSAEAIKNPTPFHRPKAEVKKYFLFICYGSLLTFSFIMEVSISPYWGRGLRALLVSGIILYHWRIVHQPKPVTLLTRTLWLSAWMLVIGSWAYFLFPIYAVPAAHILFIGGLTVMIFSVMTRVTLAHGGYNRNLEIRSKTWVWMLILFGAAMVTRLLAPWMPNYFSHLAYAAMAWLLATLCWLVLFLPKIFRKITRDSASQ